MQWKPFKQERKLIELYMMKIWHVSLKKTQQKNHQHVNWKQEPNWEL